MIPCITAVNFNSMKNLTLHGRHWRNDRCLYLGHGRFASRDFVCQLDGLNRVRGRHIGRGRQGGRTHFLHRRRNARNRRFDGALKSTAINDSVWPRSFCHWILNAIQGTICAIVTLLARELKGFPFFVEYLADAVNVLVVVLGAGVPSKVTFDKFLKANGPELAFPLTPRLQEVPDKDSGDRLRGELVANVLGLTCPDRSRQYIKQAAERIQLPLEMPFSVPHVPRRVTVTHGHVPGETIMTNRQGPEACGQPCVLQQAASPVQHCADLPFCHAVGLRPSRRRRAVNTLQPFGASDELRGIVRVQALDG